MRTLIAALGLAAAAGLAQSPTWAAAQDPVTLKWVLKEGDTFYAKTVVKTDMSIDVLGMSQDIKMTMTTVARYKVKSVKPGATVVEMTYTDVQMDADALAGAGGIGDKMKGATLTATFDDDMEITKVEGYEKLVEKLADGDPMTKQLMQALMSESAVKGMFAQVILPVPGKPLKAGDSWTRNEKIPLSGLGDLDSKSKYTLESNTGGVATIKMTGSVMFKPGKDGLKGLPFKISKTDLKSDDLKGTITFDTKAGRLKEAKQSMTVKGSMTVSAGGQDIDVGLVQKTNTTVTVTDKNPVSD